ncbi:uncharacterized protein LOC110902161 [Helianthus annuus]|uniref:uncharacterized protein LOC110902161 n=1 Tax=Helianthus annuus TaxID=4232 RepID=UPI000B905DEF|nr:uncharacterized protein LOC110902161 [Helianthus annuus]
MPPKARQGTGLPATPEELAQLIAQHVNTALEQRNANQNDGQERGCGAHGHSLSGTQIGNPPAICVISGCQNESVIRVIQRSEPRTGDSKKRKPESSKRNLEEERGKKRSLGRACVANPRESGKGKVGDEQEKCARCGQTGHVTPKCYAKSTLDGVKLKGCFVCGEQGHNKRNCPKPEVQDARGKSVEASAGKACKNPATVTGIFRIKNQSMFILLIPKLT